MDKISKLTKELINMSIENKDYSPYRKVYIGNQRAKDIGIELNDIGGFDLMYNVAVQIPDSGDRREIEYLWDGIGKWKC